MELMVLPFKGGSISKDINVPLAWRRCSVTFIRVCQVFLVVEIICKHSSKEAFREQRDKIGKRTKGAPVKGLSLSATC